MKLLALFSKTAEKKDPELWGSVVSEVKAGESHGIKGQWNARKASHAVKIYKERGGEYVGKKPTPKSNNLSKWLDEKWTTSDGSSAIKRNNEGEVTAVKRYLPEKAWESLSPAQKAATNRTKNKGFKDGKQFVPNAKAAKKAGQEARGNFSYMTTIL